MSKIQTITVSNLKAVVNQTGTFNGCSAIITAGNNKGKTSFLRGLADRITGTTPDKPLREGADNGFAEYVLTTGEKLRWEFKEKSEKLIYITDKEVKAPLTQALRDKFIPAAFDVDKFLQSPPSKQRKTLQDLAGLDFTNIDARYKTAYDERTAANTRYRDQKVRFDGMAVPGKCEAVSIEVLQAAKDAERARLNEVYAKNKQANSEARSAWQRSCDVLREEIELFNQQQEVDAMEYSGVLDASDTLARFGFTNTDLDKFVAEMLNKIQHQKTYTPLTEPTYIEEMPDRSKLDEIENKITEAHEQNRKADAYKVWLQEQDRTTEYSKLAAEAETKVQAIEKERLTLIQSAKMPEGFSFSDDGILYNGLAFTKEQLSSSGLYIAALKLSAMNIGEIRTLHFDASFLDRESLESIEQWANEQDLQLLIERPAYNGGEITYELIQQL